MSEITVEVTQSDITANVTAPNITAAVETANVTADVTTADITANVQAATVNVTINGPADKHVIEDEGVDMPARANLNFVGAGVTVTDDSANNRTIVTIPGGGGGGGTWGTIGGTLSDQTDLQTALDGKVDENAAITGATKTKITYDSKGLVTAGADAAIADISGLQSALDGKSNTGHGHTIADVTGLQTALDGKADSSHTHALSDLTQSGATTGQIVKWNGSAWAPANEAGGGGASYTEITYADAQTAIANGTLTPGGWYLITDASGTDLGFLTHAVNENTLSVGGVGGYLNADFQGVGDYSGVEAITGVAAGTQQGIWQADNEGGYLQGDIVIWNLRHWQLTDSGAVDGTNPEINTLAYTHLLKTDANQGYITAWDVSEYDTYNDAIVYRQDSRGNIVRGADIVSGLQWGRDFCTGNNIQFADNLFIRNLLASFFNNTAFPGSTISDITTGVGAIISNNIIENGAQFTGITAGASCSISRNKVGQGATLGGGMTIGDDSGVNDCELKPSASVGGNTTLGDSSNISNCFFDIGTIFSDCSLDNSCSFSYNKMSKPGVSFQNKTLNASVTDYEIQININFSETISAPFIYGTRTQQGFSDVTKAVDITGLTMLDFLLENNYVGIFNLTSSNATETISADSLVNFPTAFPFRINSSSGLTVTLTCTAAGSEVAGSIVGGAATIVLNGNNGDFVELEADPTGTFVRVKNLQNYA